MRSMNSARSRFYFRLALAAGLLAAALAIACQKARENPNPAPIPIHANLSEYGLFAVANATELRPVESGVIYDLNTPLFSDYALKFRTLHLPAGAQAQYDGEEIFDLPVGTIITKTFSFPADFRKPTENVRRIETRLLVRQPDQWIAVAYVWNKEMTDASVAYAGATTPVEFIDKDGERTSFTYAVPSRNQCGSCHQVYEGRRQAIIPIGVKARHLNRDYAYADGTENQLERLARLDLLVGLPWFGVPRAPDYLDESVAVEERARAYMDINCAHCHRANAAAGVNSKLLLTHNESDMSLVGFCKTPGSAGKGGGGLRYDIVPGRPEESILHYRMATDDPGAMMPQLGRALVHKEGVDLIARWIRAMPEETCP